VTENHELVNSGVAVAGAEPILTLGTLIRGITGQPIRQGHQVLTGAAIDSRELQAGALFVAFVGEYSDGHDHVAEAFAGGALAALVERQIDTDLPVIDLRKPVETIEAEPPLVLRVDSTLDALQAAARHWRQQLDVRVIGITGSVGKSTSKELIAEVLQQRYQTYKNPGNLNNEIGLPVSLLHVNQAHQRAVLEMGFYVSGEIELLCDIAKPHVGVITNVSEVHLERAGSMQAIIDGKAELVESLPADGHAILNFDDEHVRSFADRTQAQVFSYGLTSEAELWADQVEGLGLEGIRFVLHHAGEAFHVRVPLLGRHSVHTALRATAVGLVEGLSWDQILGGLQNTRSQLRLVAVDGPGGSILLDDTYNAAPPSVLAALNLLAELEGRRIAVLGDMLELGEFEEPGHRLVGARAADVVDQLVTVGEKARWIADEALIAGLTQAQLTTLENSQQAIDHLAGKIGEGDVVLIKGSRGLAMDTIVSALEEAR
jgi:UDP-N-acetylmuramoyl-tripeptide--D-alanyl-D-alanine ligase